jgi:hypothetical protein
VATTMSFTRNCTVDPERTTARWLHVPAYSTTCGGQGLISD